jgi:hypothetical protein
LLIAFGSAGERQAGSDFPVPTFALPRNIAFSLTTSRGASMSPCSVQLAWSSQRSVTKILPSTVPPIFTDFVLISPRYARVLPNRERSGRIDGALHLQGKTAEQTKMKMKIENNEPTVAEQHGKAGRPTKYEPKTIERLCTGLADGLPIKSACIVAGISVSTLADWREKYPELEERIADARETARHKMLQRIKRAAKDDWRAAAEWLRLTFPNDYRKSSNTGTASIRELNGRRRKADFGFAAEPPHFLYLSPA